MKKMLDSMLGLMCMGQRQLVKRLEPMTLKSGPWNEQKSGGELWVSRGHRVGEVGSGQFSSDSQMSGGPLNGIFALVSSSSWLLQTNPASSGLD